jgi:hypothetical protein
MNLTVWITQLSLLGILLFVIYNNSVNCHDYFSENNANGKGATFSFSLPLFKPSIIIIK